jgi:asparagine synthase (glutamine-hydrolysing)
MSIIFGVLAEPGASLAEDDIRHLSASTRRYATAACSLFVAGRIGMGFQPYVSHARSAMDTHPFSDEYGNVIAFDGRLDNYKYVAGLLGLDGEETSDSEIACAALRCWGGEGLVRFIGDWALAFWSAREQVLVLGRDHAGARSLFWVRQSNRLLWSTHLDTIVAACPDLRLSNDYAARYLSGQHIGEFTPYEGMRSVRPAHYIAVREDSIIQHQHWSPVITSSVFYKDDEQYEQQFLSLFGQSVARRTGPGAPVLAQLSGGMDSTSIVCMSDHLRQSLNHDAGILDTVSFYDDSEVSLDEKRYFTLTEGRRGKVGIHIDTSFSRRTFEPHDAGKGMYLLPGADSRSIQQEEDFHDLVWRKGYRSILSGIGGDEVLGGNPSATPELADYLVKGQISRLLRQSVAWSLIDQRPLILTLYETAMYALRFYARGVPGRSSTPPWIGARLREVLRKADARNQLVLNRSGIAPHRLDNGLTWWSIMETLPHLEPKIVDRPEYRYPFLDKDLIEFLFSIPREQLLRPGRRRSLMRRALKDIVPHEILERRRKAFQLHAPLSALQQKHSKLEKLFVASAIAEHGFIDIKELRKALTAALDGDAEGWQALIRAIAYELWIRSNWNGGSLCAAAGGIATGPASLTA